MKIIAENQYDYSLFTDFFERFSNAGLEGLDVKDSLIDELENVTVRNNQVFYCSDVILMDILFITKGVFNIFGIKPEEITQGYFLTTTIPEDYNRHQLARSHLISHAQKLYDQKNGTRIVSSNFRGKRSDGSHAQLLYQANMFYSKAPYESVFLLLVITEISEFKSIHKGFHFYSGNDQRFFRFPDDELLMTGNIFSHTEFNIIALIEEGYSSKEIADKLCRSVYTINTHRTNILKKSGKSTISDVIRELKLTGLM